jgi:hypothetical protein
MRKFIVNHILTIIASALILSGCYGDKGSEKYSDINEVIIDLQSSVNVILPKSDSSLVVLSPNLSQTIMQNNDNLVCKWESVEMANINTICNNQICSLYVFPGDKDKKYV